ncbi:MAG: DUF4097 domain-containing protein [Eubacterium sp.]|nr:DUF4097 domain-containing protein [Eubacterium sp.]MCM1217476.1 DUF4097 domain-containing protein [Lachnospiraceae bacterium]MCM1302517.1 DUF4097 domain-containing protein [Butyrivibrio sp.]MCM1342355.1 DUF4097 domain-containing protein [Muribaculaceae bacterium]MCM1065502.1 DUF4097 domain-containing protein [Eubacterium sp.]
MKKFMKGCAITALILFVIGFVLATVASTVRGRTTIENVVESVTGGRVRVHLNPFDWGVYVDDMDVLDWVDDFEIFDDVDFDVEDNMSFDSHHTILRGNVDRYSLGSDIRELDFEIGACSFTTQPSPDGNFYLEAAYAGKIQGYVEDGTLYIRSTASVKRWNDLNGCRIILYVPENAYFEEADIEVGAGRLEFDRLQAKEISLEVGAGQISLDKLQSESLKVSVGLGQIALENMTVGELDAEVGMGEFVAAGALNGDGDVECAMGNVSLTLEGNQKDFNYGLSKAMGNVTLGSSSSSGFASDQYLDNNAFKTMDIECAVGNVTIQFTK